MVNTFIVHADFSINAKILDDKRLGKQRAVAKQILLKIEDLLGYGTSCVSINYRVKLSRII